MVNHFQDDPNPPPFIKALAEVRHLATRDDQYAAKAFGNREYIFTDR